MTNATPSPAWQPLKGVRVLELAQIMAGPVAGLMLADLGADVIKVEKFPGGDDARGFNSQGAGGVTASFEVLNRGKRSIAVNLKTDQGRAALRRLVARADVLTENFRPGTMQALGLGPEDLHEINPRLIYCSVTGYGNRGPLAGRGGFDLILQAFCGLISVTGEPGRAPVKPGISIADVNAGILAALGVLGAYVHVLRTGQGQHVETSLLQASMQQLYWYAALFFSGQEVPQRLGTAHPVAAPYQTYTCSDGEIALGGANESNWSRITEVVGHPEWRDDPRFSTSQARLRNRASLTECLNAALAGHTRAHWEALLTAAGVPAGPVQSVAEALSHPQARAVDMVVDAQTADGGLRPMIGLPIHFSGRNEPASTAAPRLGEHTSQVLAQAGFSDDEISELITGQYVLQVAPAAGR
ncbi:CaiB/BaiF CoA transferase family protein [Ramlibacter rhizophilus]|uniref:CoA transferase n=1 Tax=Ramlibacter rhizophilus TaxID=1781167 RepID=A0A4Z0C3H0_9BURK|nr:CoA transferase [Ramlibacter rhizophilus]TFZ05020.1 CoA transferase [Ramlibacter rhizophilus]